MPREYTISCPKCGSCIHIQIQPVNALIHLSCLRCGKVIFNSIDKMANFAPIGRTPINLPQIQPGSIVIANRYSVIKKWEVDDFSRMVIADDVLSRKKVLLRIFTHKDENVHRRLQELMNLQHKNLYNHHDIGVYKDRYFVVYNFEEGDTLENILQQRRIVPRHVLTIILRVAEAVKYLHENDCIGVEILSKNILITHNRVVKLQKYSDNIFTNIARHVKSLTIASVAEMSLERIRNAKKGRTPASDVYALGAVLYEALTGVKAFCEYGRNLFEHFGAKLQNNYVRIGERNPYISDKLVYIVETAMHHNPQQRFTINTMISELQLALQLEEQSKHLQQLDENMVKYFFQEQIEEIVCSVETSMKDVLEEDLNNKKVNNRYLLKRQLGKNCFLVFDEHQYRLAAMKIVRNISPFSLLEQVLQVASKPIDGVVEWYHCEQKSDFILLLQKYMYGENLQVILDKKAILRPHKAIEVCCEVLNVLERLHENSVACGELKLGDIFIDMNNKNKVYLVNAYLYYAKNSLMEQRPLDELIALDIAFVGSVLENLLSSSRQALKIISSPIRQVIQNIIAEMKNATSGIKQIKEKLQLDMVYNIFCHNCGWHSRIQQGKNWTCHECNMHLHLDEEQPKVKYICKSPLKQRAEICDDEGNMYIGYALPENVDKEKLKTLCFHQPLGIMRYLEFWQKNNKTYVVCERQIGIPLPQVLDTISVSRLFMLIEKVCLVLERLHKLHLTHNNLTPTNILVEGDDTLLIDVWLYPEQSIDSEYCDPRHEKNIAADIYSLGRVLKFVFEQAQFRDYQQYFTPAMNDVITQNEQRFATVRNLLDELQEIKQRCLLQ